MRLPFVSDVFGSAKEKRLKFVLGGWIAINSYTRDVLTYFNDPVYNLTGVQADYVAIGAYVGFPTLNHFYSVGGSAEFHRGRHPRSHGKLD